MKLKEGFILHKAGNEYMAVASGKALDSFNGLIRLNETAYFILQQLQNETTEEAVIEAVCAEYDAPKQNVASDVRRTIEKLRSEGLIDE